MARILVVEDDPAQRFLFVQLLRRTGYDAVSAGSGQAALDLLTGGTPVDAVLTDICMPGMDGNALRMVLARSHAALPVVMMSVMSGRDWNLNSGAESVYFLQKPFEREALAQTLHLALTTHRRSGV